MSQISRGKTRKFLFQALYARTIGGESFDVDGFIDAFYDADFREGLDWAYFREVYAGILREEPSLIRVVEIFAPKFDARSMPVGNIIIIAIGAYEMLYAPCGSIPVNVSINEALELAKLFSDEHAKLLVNGVLNALKQEISTVRTRIAESPATYSLFPPHVCDENPKNSTTMPSKPE